jgi:hypothetical protein
MVTTCLSSAPERAFVSLLARHGVRYLVIGGLAFIYHAKPRFTKDTVTTRASCGE